MEPIKVLFLGDNGHHEPRGRFAELAPVLVADGIEMTDTDDVSDLNFDKLRQSNAPAVYANMDEISQDQADAIMRYVAAAWEQMGWAACR